MAFWIAFLIKGERIFADARISVSCFSQKDGPVGLLVCLLIKFLVSVTQFAATSKNHFFQLRNYTCTNKQINKLIKVKKNNSLKIYYYYILYSDVIIKLKNCMGTFMILAKRIHQIPKKSTKFSISKWKLIILALTNAC